MHDTGLEERLRSVLRQEGDSLPFTITSDELERRLVLRRRDRNGRRLSLMAAGLAAVAVGAIFALSNGWLANAPAVGADVSLSPAPTASSAPTPAPSIDPLAALPVLVQDPESLAFHMTEGPGDPADPDPNPGGIGLDGVPMEAREAGIKVVCLGPDSAFLVWGTINDQTAVASESFACDGTIRDFRYDIAARQPMLGYSLMFEASPRTAYRVLVESFGATNDPVPTALPSFATPDGRVVLDAKMTSGTPAGGPAAPPGETGSVPPRGFYRVAMVCLGEGSARWSIGAEGERDFVAAGDVPCDGAAIGFEPAEGIPQGETTVWVSTTDPGSSWHIVITDPHGAPSFIAPQLNMWNGTEIGVPTVAGLAQCVSHGEGGDSCAGAYSARDGAAEVSIPLGGEVTFSLADGWEMREARVTAIPRAVARSDPFATATDVIYYPAGGDQLTASLAGLEAGEWIIRVAGGGTKDGDSFGAFYDIPVTVRE